MDLFKRIISIIRIGSILLLVFGFQQISAQQVYEIDPAYPVHDINGSLFVVAEEELPYLPDQILHDTSLTYTIGSDLPIHLELRKTYWGKIQLMPLDSLTQWTLHFQDYMLGAPAWGKSNGRVDVYAYSDDQLLFHRKSGVEYPIKDRDIKENWLLNRVSVQGIPINEITTLVIRVEGNSLGYPPFFKLSLRSPDQSYYHEIHQSKDSFNMFMFGVSFIIFLYHFLLFLYLKQRVFLWFSIWLFFCAMTQAMSVGHVIGSIHFFRYPIWMFFASGVFIPFWFFGREFISTKQKYPVLDKAILVLCATTFIEMVITAIYVVIKDPLITQTSVGLHYPFLLLFNFIGFVLAIFLLFKKDAYARYFAVGVLIGSVAFITGLLWAMGIVRPPMDPFALSMFLQIIIYSFGIAYRRQRLDQVVRDERLKAQQTEAEVQRIKDLDNIKSKFFANISHEFRTPLALISGPLEHAALSSGTNKNGIGHVSLTNKDYSIIKRNTNRLQNLIDQLLEISKIESGQIHLSLSQGSLVQFIKSIVVSFESLAERKNISLNTSFPEEITGAFYDKDKLEKIVSNLLSNALKYTPRGGSVIAGLNIEEGHFSIEIKDSGKGIKQEELNKVFDRFYRVERSESEGAGIGLALTKELVDLHNGQINVSSNIGSGTAFKVRLPYTLSDLPQTISVISNGGKADVVNQRQSTNLEENFDIDQAETEGRQYDDLPVLLVVEDNVDLQDFIKTILAESYEIIQAKDGLQGERMAFEHVPDLIISDIMMPGKDGYELCNTLKSNTKTSHIPIVMLTAKAGQSNKLEGLTIGADAFLTKPFDERELKVRLKNLLSARFNLWEHFKSLDLSILPELELSSAEDKFFQKVIGEIKDNLDNERLSVEDISRAVGFSRSQLHRKLKAIAGKSTNQLIVEVRLNEAYRMLENRAGSVSEIAYSVGYSSMSYFTKSFKDQFGILPSKVSNQVEL